jgi:hypothetical protein
MVSVKRDFSTNYAQTSENDSTKGMMGLLGGKITYFREINRFGCIFG